ncbi:E3 ubiquitin-protein ligase COP1-like [Hyposmocoma kahamanoa]|uniref:E3 ubiquitin-protein ligase COP1-like n=1 Tax=Hyposmocoma kahamanoa TaxID=1477025 RepID=UPI000E6DA186|nr:E3 ubiquitin-protein ligase COP1-like [Hyposmocoma kahamanoa]
MVLYGEEGGCLQLKIQAPILHVVGVPNHPSSSENLGTLQGLLKALRNIWKMSGTAASGSNQPGPSTAAVALDGLGGSLEDKDCDLLCPVCFELIEEAYVTRCGHSFCYSCIAKSVELHRRCPKCGAALASRDHIFPNFLLNELVAKRRAQWGRLGAGVTGAGGAARAAGAATVPGEADRLRALVANESRHLSLHDVQAMLEALTRRKRLLEAESAAAHHRLLYEFLAQLHRQRHDQLEQLAREAALVRKDMDHVAGVLKELRAGAAGLARLPSLGGDAADGGGGPAGDAVRALRSELAEIAGSVSDTGISVALDGAATEGGEESFAGGGMGGGTDALAARWRRLTQHFDDFVQVGFALFTIPTGKGLAH